MGRSSPALILHTVLALLLATLSAPALALAPPTTYATPATPPTSTIAQARRLPVGTIVTVEGSVTVPAGAFKSGTFDAGFAIQDRTGGIYVHLERNLGLHL